MFPLHILSRSSVEAGDATIADGHFVSAADQPLIEEKRQDQNRSDGQRQDCLLILSLLLEAHSQTVFLWKFDHIVSNFGGLNCTDNLKDVLLKLSPLLNAHGKVTLMIMPRVCPWELILMFKGKFKTAFRRFKKNTPAHIEGVNFSCYYYNPGYVITTLKKEFDVVTLKGVCITVPPEFYQGFVERYPKLFSLLKKTDKAICSVFPFNRWCDHYMITLQKK